MYRIIEHEQKLSDMFYNGPEFILLVSVHQFYLATHRFVISFFIMRLANDNRAMQVNRYAKRKHLGCKKVQGQSEVTLQTGRHDQKV